MGQLKLTPQPNVLSLRGARSSRGEANSSGEVKETGYRPGATEAGLPLTPQRLELVKAYAKNAPRRATAPTASQIAQRFAHRAEPPSPSGAPQPASHVPLLASFSTLASGIRRLTALVIFAALLPNLTLAAFWLHLLEPPWSQSLTPGEGHIAPTKSEIAAPVLSAPSVLEASAGDDVLLPIALDGTDGVPAGSVIVIGGLPRGSTLSSGRLHGETDWALRPDEIGDLHLILAAGSSESMLTIQLLAPNNGILADAATILKETAGPVATTAADTIEAEPAEGFILRNPPERLEVAAVAENPVNLNDATSMSGPVPLPTRRPAPNVQDNGRANWIRPTAYVNLREGPSSTARILSVVAKGAKLRIVARKRGWVQVIDPATSHSGWIYSGNVGAMP